MIKMIIEVMFQMKRMKMMMKMKMMKKKMIIMMEVI